uniref:Uncharacterized protein n=1 Tax=Ditylenchus dipsaci TaxID=166011 RepID=A0A915DQK3_9BILA
MAAHCFYVVIFVAFVVAVLLLSFFFRPYAVLFFNGFLVVLGTLSMHNISYSMLSVFVSDRQLFSLSQLCCFSSLNCLTFNKRFLYWVD